MLDITLQVNHELQSQINAKSEFTAKNVRNADRDQTARKQNLPLTSPNLAATLYQYFKPLWAL